jgi:ABC-type lipoprotein export system ATPase subunit
VVAEGVQKVLPQGVIRFAEPRVGLHPGQLRLIVGPSGCGKSSLLRVLALQDRAYQGTVTVLGETVPGGKADESRLNRLRSEVIHYIPQRHQGLLGRSPVENIATWLMRLDGFGAAEAQCAAENALEAVGLARRQFHVTVGPPNFSGGQQARVAIACALARRRPVCFADEVLAGLDWESAKELVGLLKRYLADRHAAVAVVWHLPADNLDELPFDQPLIHVPPFVEQA